jgi:hypothetical protein
MLRHNLFCSVGLRGFLQINKKKLTFTKKERLLQFKIFPKLTDQGPDEEVTEELLQKS